MGPWRLTVPDRAALPPFPGRPPQRERSAGHQHAPQPEKRPAGAAPARPGASRRWKPAAGGVGGLREAGRPAAAAPGAGQGQAGPGTATAPARKPGFGGRRGARAGLSRGWRDERGPASPPPRQSGTRGGGPAARRTRLRGRVRPRRGGSEERRRSRGAASRVRAPSSSSSNRRERRRAPSAPAVGSVRARRVALPFSRGRRRRASRSR